MKIIGQTNIIDFIDKSKIDTFPRTFMLYGIKVVVDILYFRTLAKSYNYLR